MALRRRGVAFWLAALGAFSLAITYVVPVAATLSAGGATISPLRELAAPTFEFPTLRVPAVSRAVVPPPVPTLVRPEAPRSTSPLRWVAAQTVPVVTSLYVTRPQPSRSAVSDSSLPTYEDSTGVAVPAIAVPDRRPLPMPPAPATSAPATPAPATPAPVATAAPATAAPSPPVAVQAAAPARIATTDSSTISSAPTSSSAPQAPTDTSVTTSSQAAPIEPAVAELTVPPITTSEPPAPASPVTSEATVAVTIPNSDAVAPSVEPSTSDTPTAAVTAQPDPNAVSSAPATTTVPGTGAVNVLVGTSSTETVAPESSTAAPTPAPTTIPDPNANTASGLSPPPTLISATDGGTITTPDAAATLTFAPNSVAGDVNVTIAPSSASPPAGIQLVSAVYDLSAVDATTGTSVSIFAAPPQLTLSFDPSVTGSPSIYYLDPSGNAIQLPSTVDPLAHTVTAALPHFSDYVAGVQSNETTETDDPTGLDPVASIPDLIPASDSGFSQSDDYTSDVIPFFDVIADAYSLVELLEGGIVLGSAFADVVGLARVQVDVAHTLADGLHQFSARARLDLLSAPGPESASLSVMIDTVAPLTPVLDLDAVEDSGYSSADNVTNINYWHYVANTAGEPAFGYLHELSPNGRSTTGGAYNANVAEWGFAGTYAPYADAAGGLGADGRQGVWTYTAWAVDYAGNLSDTSAPLAILFDTVAPLTPVLDLPAVEDSGYSSSDNVTNLQPWHFWATSLGEQGFFQTREIAPTGRDVTSAIPTVAAGTPCCGYYYYPDALGGFGVDGRQGVWTYSAYGEDLAGNVTPWSNTLAILFDTVAPAGSFMINNDTPIINGEIATRYPDLTLELDFDDTLSGLSEMQFSSDGGASFDPAESYGDIGALTLSGPDGIFTVAVMVTDLAGNSLTTTKDVRLDTTGPDITTGGIGDGSSYDVGALLTFTYGATDVDNVDTINATLDGTGTLTSGATVGTSSLAAGSHTIVVSATDELGNLSTVSVTFEVHASALGLCSGVNDGVAGGLVHPNMQNPLCTKARAAEAAISRGDYADAKSILASFISQVAVAQAGKKIDPGYADLLMGWANDLIARLP